MVFRSRATVKMFAVKMCNANSEMWSLFCRICVGPQNRLWAPLGNIFENKSNIWRGVKFHSRCEPRSSVIQCGVNKSLHSYSVIILDVQGVGVPSRREAPLQMSAYLRWVVGRLRVNGRLRDMFVEPGTSVWALFKRAAGHSGKTSSFSLGLTWFGTACSGMIAVGTETPDPWLTQGAEKADSQDTFDHSPTDSLVYGCRGYARYTAFAGI